MAPTGAKGGLWVKEVPAVSKTPLRALGRVLVCFFIFFCGVTFFCCNLL